MSDYEKPKRQSMTQRSKGPDSQCSHRAGNLRCCLPATWYPGGSSATMGYCRLHTEDEKRLHGSHGFAQLEHIRDYRSDYLEEFYPKGNWREAAVDQLIADNPRWKRLSDESKSAYWERIRHKRKEAH